MRSVETAAPPPVTAPLFLSPGHGRILLVANNFPPIRGGSAVVYDTLARHAGGRVMVLAATRGYADGLPQIGWREHDRAAPYRVLRLKLLRTMLGQRRETGLARAWFALTDGENGLVADGREVASVERAMRRMIAEPELRARLAAGGLARAAAADWRWKAAEFLGVGLG